MKLAIAAITDGGKKLAHTLATPLSATILDTEKSIKTALKDNWAQFDGFICIMACGIVVRSIATLLKDKKTDPAIVVVDEKGKHAISLLSGHIGGGNKLARKVAELTAGTPVITTASDTLHLTALDLWCKSQNLVTNDNSQLTKASSKLVNSGQLLLYSDCNYSDLPKEFIITDDIEKADIIISIYNQKIEGKLILHPKIVVAGMGCNRGTPVHEFDEALHELCAELNISTQSIGKICSIDKKSDEKGLLEFAQTMQLPIDFFSKDQINTFTELEISDAAMKAVGAIGVAEPCALLGAENKKTESINNLISKKRKWKNITIALALAPYTLSAQVQEPSIT